MPSVHGASILGYHQRSSDDDDEVPKETAVSFAANRDGWVRTIKDLGLQFDFVSSDQIEQGNLASGNYKVLILPLSVALSTSEIKNIESFVQNGGVVIADAATGLMDQHCAWRLDNSLNDLFGISALSSDTRTFKPNDQQREITDEGAKWGLGAKTMSGFTAVEPDIQATGGTPFIKVGKTHAVVARQKGKGWTIYLNTLFDKYPRQRAEKFGGGQYRTLVAGLLKHVGVNPSIQLYTTAGNQLTQAQVARYRFGEAEIVTVVKDNLGADGVAGQDGVTTYNDGNLGQIARQEIVFKLPAKFFVTDVRSGKKLGYTDTVRSSLIVGDAAVLSLSAVENTLALNAPTAASRGEHVRMEITSSVRGPRLVRCHVFGPDGSMMPAYAQNLLIDNASTTFTFPSALNDPVGSYLVRATDIVSGATTETKLVLK